MAKKNKLDPTWRYEELWCGHIEDLNCSLDEFISKFQSIKVEALSKNPKLESFNIQCDFSDEYDIGLSVHAQRPETEEEKLWRLGKHPTQLEAKKAETAKSKASQIEVVRQLCKRLKVQSPV